MSRIFGAALFLWVLGTVESPSAWFTHYLGRELCLTYLKGDAVSKHKGHLTLNNHGWKEGMTF